jgi:hypothetical protein
LSFLNTLFTELIIGISLKPGFIRSKGFMILLEEEVAITLFMIGLDKVFILFNSNLIVLLGSLEIHKFDGNLAKVTIVLCYFGVAFNGFFVFLQSLWEFT